MNTKITINAVINADIHKVWDYYTNPSHIINWNFAHPSWHCPSASNDMRTGGTYKARMEARDGSFGFDFEAIYTHIDPLKSFIYGMGDRNVEVSFNSIQDSTELTIVFDAESENPVEIQKQGWQAILDNFKNYTENN